MTRTRRYFTAPLALTLLGVALSGCITTIADPQTGRYASPIGNAPVITNETPYSRSLACLAVYNAGRPAPRIAVGQIADYTGKEEADGSGRKITQGAALMAITALSKAGVRLVERFDTSVAELELKYANNKLIGAEESPYRKILAGSIPGSDYYLVGGITELNFNIRSEGAEADYSGDTAKSVKANVAARAYVMNVGLDMRLVDTRTLEVVDVISYQKQIIGREISAGVFDILGHNIINIGGGDSALEPVQLAVRSVIERAVLEMVSRLYDADPSACFQNNGHGDPLGDPAPAAFNSPSPSPGSLAPASVPRPNPIAAPPVYAPNSTLDSAENGSPAPKASARLAAGHAQEPPASQPTATTVRAHTAPKLRPKQSSFSKPASPSRISTSKETSHAQSNQGPYRRYSDAADDTNLFGLRGRIQ